MLLEKGYYVFATYVGPDFTKQYANFEAVKTDQTSRQEVYRFLDYVKGKTGHIDCIICNAGMSIRKSFTIDNPFVNGSLIEVNGGYCYK